jgi:AAA family ATP:ADP antiporter
MSDSVLAMEGPGRSALDRFLARFSVVHAGEGLSAILLAANVFLLLAGYYVLKTVREPLILDQPGGAEVKSYSSAGQALLFLIVVPLFGFVASRVNRAKLVGGVMAFFVTNLIVFAALGRAGVRIGVAYYLWLGIFNMLSVAQFWGFANDLYTEEQGKRLFPIVGVGASVGAWVGSRFAGQVYRAMGPYQLMLISAAVLAVCVLLTVVVHRREAGRAGIEKKKEAEAPVGHKGGFALLASSRYLGLIAILVLLLNTVNTLGGYLLDTFLGHSAAALPEAERGAFYAEFYGDYYFAVNLLGFLIQTFLVSRLFKWFGVRRALFALPVIALFGYSAIAIVPVLMVVQVAKILENATDYSLNNTVRHALYLPTPREAKYKAKAATDTFFVRFGDMLQAGIVYAGTTLAFSVGQFATVNIALAAAWIGIAVLVYRQHKHLATEA